MTTGWLCPSCHKAHAPSDDEDGHPICYGTGTIVRGPDGRRWKCTLRVGESCGPYYEMAPADADAR